MEIRTYGVTGFMDWQCEIPVGKARAIVHFTGGCITAYGVTPAEYSTGDPVKQRIIEGSAHFRSGRIKLLRKNGTPDAPKPKATKRAAAAPKPVSATESQQEEKPVSADTPATEETAPDTTVEATPTEQTAIAEETAKETQGAQASDAGQEEQAEETAPAEVALTEVTVSCLTEAQNYLRDHFGIATSRSRSKEKAQTFARENGIVFVGL